MWGVDAMAEAAFEFSPFAYAFNNPIMLNDPSGLFPLAAFGDYENERKKEGMVTAEDRGNGGGGQKTPTPTIHVLLMKDDDKQSNWHTANNGWCEVQRYLESNEIGEALCFNFKITSLKKIKINDIKKNDALIIVGDNRKQIIDLVASWGGEYKQWTECSDVKDWKNWTQGKDNFPEVSNNPSIETMPKNINIGVIDRNTTAFTFSAQSTALLFMHILGHNSGFKHDYSVPMYNDQTGLYENSITLPAHGIMKAKPDFKNANYSLYGQNKENSMIKALIKMRFNK
jgi:hypothetical protein